MKAYVYKHLINGTIAVISLNPYVVYTKDKSIDLRDYELKDILSIDPKTFNINNDHPELLI